MNDIVNGSFHRRGRKNRVVNDVVNALLQGRKTSVVNDAGIGVGSESWIALPRHPPPPHGLKRSLLPPGSRASPLSGGTCLGGGGLQDKAFLVPREAALCPVTKSAQTILITLPFSSPGLESQRAFLNFT